MFQSMCYVIINVTVRWGMYTGVRTYFVGNIFALAISFFEFLVVVNPRLNDPHTPTSAHSLHNIMYHVST